MAWDVFISHAFEDKEFARALADSLSKNGLRVWFDEFELKVGDSLRRSIDTGLSKSKFGIVVLSPNFFSKEWTQKELDALTARETKRRKIILPVWHNISAKEIKRYSPMLADRFAIDSIAGIDETAKKLLSSIQFGPRRSEEMRKAQAEQKWLDQLTHSNRLLYAIAQITTHIEKAFSVDDIIQNLSGELNELDLTYIMAVYNKERASFVINYTSIQPQILEIIEKGLGYPLVKYTFPRDKLNPESILHPAVLSNPEDEIRILSDRTRRQDLQYILQEIDVKPNTILLRLPMILEENLLGILWIWGKGP